MKILWGSLGYPSSDFGNIRSRSGEHERCSRKVTLFGTEVCALATGKIDYVLLPACRFRMSYGLPASSRTNISKPCDKRGRCSAEDDMNKTRSISSQCSMPQASLFIAAFKAIFSEK